MRVPATLLVWAGVLGAPAAWFTQFVGGQWLSESSCRPAGGGISAASWALPATAVAAAVALLAGLCAFRTFRTLEDIDEDAAPPDGRVRFLAVAGMVISPLFLCIILLGGIGALALTSCGTG